MLNLNSAKMDQKPSCTFPTTKLKNISCVFCRHHFYIRDLSHLKNAHLPLLLNCGHAVCQNCSTKHTGDPCPLCTIIFNFGDSDTEQLLPVNVYVIGLLGVAHSRPVHGVEPDISFSQAMTTRMKQQSVDQGCCFSCGMQAVLRCLQCNDLLCHKCSTKIHNELTAQGQNAGHFRVMLTDYSKDPIFKIKTCNTHKNDAIDYFCENCNISGCARCMLEFHKQHNCVSQSVKNEEYMEEFQRSHDKLAETMQRIRQAQKNLKRSLVFPDELLNSETIEAGINQHFAHLHGVLQNIERGLIEKLYEQRDYITRNLNEIQHRLQIHEDQVQAGLLMASSLNDYSGKVNLKDVITKLESLADVPCHLVDHPITDDEKIIFSCDPAVIEMLENHCKLKLPEVAGFNLLKEDTLPTDYEMEACAAEPQPGPADETFSLESSLVRSTSYQSLSSRRPEVPSLKPNSCNMVHVCHIESPSNFYVRLAAHRQESLEVERQLSYNAENKMREPDSVELNKIYAVKRIGGKWFRGRVNAINTNHGKPDTYEIFNMDYGKTENPVTKSRMRVIPEQLASMPQTIINCALNDIAPKDGKWQSDARKKMTAFCKPKDSRMVCMYMYVATVEENRYLVDICKEPTSDGEGKAISMRDSLIFSGLGSLVSSQHLHRTNPQAVRKYYRENFELNTFQYVKCSHVNTPDCIYVQKADDYLLHLSELTEKISLTYNEVIRSTNKKEMIHVPEIGMPCAFHKGEGVWSRAIIINVPAPETVEVFLVDHGLRIQTNYERIRKLHESFMVTPAQAIKVSLVDIEPRDKVQWSREAIAFTKRNLEDIIARIVAFEKNESGYNVALYMKKDANFAAILATKGFAASTGPRSSGIVEVPNHQPNRTGQKSKVRNSRTLKTKKGKRRNIGVSVLTGAEAIEAKCDAYRLPVKIIRAESPDTIYVANPTYEKEYEAMMEQMQKFYNANKEVSDKSKWEVDFLCVVYFTCDRVYCRGKITAIKSPDEVEVFLYDLAFTVTVPIGELQALKKKFWRTPTYAFKVKLAGISPCGGSKEWLSTSCEKLKDLLIENQRSKFYISKVTAPDEGDLCVDLWVEQVKFAGPLSPGVIEINSINRMMVDEGLAVTNKLYNNKSKLPAIDLERHISNKEKEQRDESSKFFDDLPDSDVTSPEESGFSNSNSSQLSVALNGSTLESSKESFASWLPAEPIKDDKFVAVPTYLDHDCYLHLHSVAQNKEQLNMIERCLESEYSKLNIEPNDFEWKKGDLCIAKYHGNKKWYRGQVRSVENNDIQVEFIDYGNIEKCELGTLTKRLTMTDVPSQKTKCVIHGLYPDTPTHKWREHDLDTIHHLLVDKECEITVVKRMEDHLVVSIEILSPTRCDLIRFLVNDLRIHVKTDLGVEYHSGTEIDSTLECSADVVIDEYVNDKSGDENDVNVNKKDIEKEEANFADEESIKVENEDNFTEKDSEKNEFCTLSQIHFKEDKDDDLKEKGIEEEGNDNDLSAKEIEVEKDLLINVNNIDVDVAHDSYLEETNGIENQEDYESDIEENESTVIADVPSVVSVEHLKDLNNSIDSDDFSVDDIRNLIYNGEDIVLSGAPNFTHGPGQIELSQEEAIRNLDCISLPDSTGVKEEELVTSTPFNESIDCDSSDLYKQIIFPEDLKVIKAEIAVVGFPVSWLHLLDNKNSEIVTEYRQKYEKIVADMQKHAEKQPFLKDIAKGTPCCVKYTDDKWYRCVVINCKSARHVFGDIVQVCFIDWGNPGDVRFDEMRAMKEEWLEAPWMSVPCKLWDVEKAPTVGENVFNDKLWKSYNVIAMSTKTVYAKLKACCDEIYDVQMYTDKKCRKLIYDSLIKEGVLVKKSTTKGQ